MSAFGANTQPLMSGLVIFAKNLRNAKERLLAVNPSAVQYTAPANWNPETVSQTYKNAADIWKQIALTSTDQSRRTQAIAYRNLSLQLASVLGKLDKSLPFPVVGNAVSNYIDPKPQTFDDIINHANMFLAAAKAALGQKTAEYNPKKM